MALRGVLAALIVVLLGVAAAVSAHADEPSGPNVVAVSDLLEEPMAHTGDRITIEGELVGDYGFRSDGYMWTQLNDDSYARDALVDGGPRTGSNIGIGLRMPSELAAELDPAGGYRLEGPLVRATGYWRYHDPVRSGESFFDAEQLDIVREGRRLEEGPDWIVFASGVLLLAVSATLWFIRPREEAE